MRKSMAVAMALLLLLGATGCDHERAAQFGTFAAAGTAYVTTFHGFTDEAGRAFIAADSASLLTARLLAGGQVAAHRQEFVRDLTASDAQMQQYLRNLQRLDAHASLLGAYFAALTRLTDGKASNATVASLDGLVDALSAFNPQIETVSFGGHGVKGFMHPAAELIIAHYQVKMLNRELQRSAPVIDRALALQQAAVEALGAQMQASQGASLAGEEEAAVVEPYVTAGPLRPDWTVNRNAYLRRQAALAGVVSASAAITELHQAFRDLVAGKGSSVDFPALLAAIGKMAGYTARASAIPAR